MSGNQVAESKCSADAQIMNEMARALVVGLGNPVRCDDGVGLHVVRRLIDTGLPEGVTAIEAGAAGLDLLDSITGCDRLIIVDAIDMGRPPGAVLVLDLADLPRAMPLHFASSHEADLPTIMALGRKLGLRLPQRVVIVAVQVADITSFAMTCTDAVDAAIPKACREIARHLV